MLKVMRISRWRDLLRRHREELATARREPPLAQAERERFRQASALIDELWEEHSKPVCHDKPGFGFIGQTWYCSSCRQQWPCDTARRLATWGQAGSATQAEYEPLRLQIVGEQRLDGVVKVGNTAFSAPGVRADFEDRDEEESDDVQ